MKNKVPYYSQFRGVVDRNLQEKVCTMAVLKMVLEYMRNMPAPAIEELFKEANIIQEDMVNKGLIAQKAVKAGFSHDVIVFLAHNRGVPAYKEEFKSVEVDLISKIFTKSFFVDEILQKGIRKFARIIKSGGVIMTSVVPGFSTNLDAHVVLLIGLEEKKGQCAGFYYHDPDDRSGGGKDEYIDIENFKKVWRKLAVIFEK